MNLTNPSASQRLLLYLLLLVVSLSACVPCADGDTRVLYFSAEVWGGSPFSEGQKRRVFLEALSSQSVRRLTQSVAFEFEEPGVSVRRFAAVYEVNAKQKPPLVKNGYQLILELSEPPPERITLRNSETDVTWSLRIDDAAN